MAAATIDPQTTLGAVRLTVADLERTRSFYERAIGLTTLGRDEDGARLGAGSIPIVELVADPQAPPRPVGTTGLFHLAVLVPDRAELARSLRRVIAADWGFTGASDHLVSESLYLSDPEGNGIELYRDRPREQWQRVEGQLQMGTFPLDLESLLGEAGGEIDGEGAAMPAGTRIGHVHLNVADLDTTERFYSGVLGFEITVRGYPGALFAAAGGYHHHFGLNTWAGEGAPPPPRGARGLRSFEVVLPSQDALDSTLTRLEQGAIELRQADGATLIDDPSSNTLSLTVAGAA
jgi:catechol 2,3-dioxygenase